MIAMYWDWDDCVWIDEPEPFGDESLEDEEEEEANT